MTKKNYIEPAEFFTETLECIKREKVSNKLAEMFMLLSERRINHRMFVRYAHIREDLIAIGCEACCRAFMKFRPNRNILIRDDESGEVVDKTKVQWDGEMLDYDYETCYNPYSFFSRVIENACLQYIKKEYNERNIVNKIKLENGLDADFGYLDAMREDDFDEALIQDSDDLILEMPELDGPEVTD